jgi:hypothetical protein
MIPSNNYDKLILKKILDALRIFQEACCTENAENANNPQKLISTLPIIIAEKTKKSCIRYKKHKKRRVFN